MKSLVLILIITAIVIVIACCNMRSDRNKYNFTMSSEQIYMSTNGVMTIPINFNSNITAWKISPHKGVFNLTTRQFQEIFDNNGEDKNISVSYTNNGTPYVFIAGLYDVKIKAGAIEFYLNYMFPATNDGVVSNYSSVMNNATITIDGIFSEIGGAVNAAEHHNALGVFHHIDHIGVGYNKVNANWSNAAEIAANHGTTNEQTQFAASTDSLTDPTGGDAI
jgi:hypothetical protein